MKYAIQRVAFDATCLTVCALSLLFYCAICGLLSNSKRRKGQAAWHTVEPPNLSTAQLERFSND